MKIKWDSDWLADDTVKPFGLTVNGQRVVQVAHFLRAAQAAFFTRKNTSLRLSFSVVQTFSTIKSAELWVLQHYGSIGDQATLTLRVGQTSESPEDVICQNAVLETVEFPRILGVSVEARYTFSIPGITGVSVTPDSDEMQSGTASIGNGVASVTVTGLGLSVPPVRVLVSVRKPSAGYNLFASAVDGSFTTDGFTADLSGLTNSADYQLDYTLMF